MFAGIRGSVRYKIIPTNPVGESSAVACLPALCHRDIGGSLGTSIFATTAISGETGQYAIQRLAEGAEFSVPWYSSQMFVSPQYVQDLGTGNLDQLHPLVGFVVSLSAVQSRFHVAYGDDVAFVHFRRCPGVLA